MKIAPAHVADKPSLAFSTSFSTTQMTGRMAYWMAAPASLVRTGLDRICASSTTGFSSVVLYSCLYVAQEKTLDLVRGSKSAGRPRKVTPISHETMSPLSPTQKACWPIRCPCSKMMTVRPLLLCYLIRLNAPRWCLPLDLSRKPKTMVFHSTSCLISIALAAKTFALTLFPIEARQSCLR